RRDAFFTGGSPGSDCAGSVSSRVMDYRMASLCIGMVTLAGCPTTDDRPPECQPACPAGTRCTADGCVPGDTDLGLPPIPDLAGACVPACSGMTPYCNDKGVCVPCVADAHCPNGQVCRAFGGSSACVPGCHDDARCAALGASVKCCGEACVDTSKDAQNC